MTKEPRNYAFWKSIIDNSDDAAEVMVRGNDRQKKELKKVFKYIESQKKTGQFDLFDDEE